MKNIILGIDFNNLLCSSYYGEKIINSKNQNINAIKGFFYKLKILIESIKPTYTVICNDISRERTFRRKLFTQYKAQRKPSDPDISFQIQKTLQILSLSGYPIINNELYEADDILGMISKFSYDNNYINIIASSDRDLYQLINDKVFIYSTRDKEIIDEAYMKQKYSLTPQQWVEYKMIQGDRSDNIPGIPGIGETTALKLMQQYHSIENIYKNKSSLRDVLRHKLEAGKDSLQLTRELVTIITDYTKINLTEEMLKPHPQFIEDVFLTLRDLELTSLFNIFNYYILPMNIATKS